METDELVKALHLADRLLDVPNADPDDDLRLLSRWLIRVSESYEEVMRSEYRRTSKPALSLRDRIAVFTKAQRERQYD